VKRKKREATFSLYRRRFRCLSDDSEPQSKPGEILPDVKAYEPPAPFPERLETPVNISVEEKLEEFKEVMLNEECSAILTHQTSPTMNNLMSLSTSCKIKQYTIDKILCDPSLHMNFISLELVEKLDPGEVKPSHIILYLANGRVQYPWGLIKDVIVKVDKLEFIMDFQVIDDESEYLVLGKPFLDTSGALLNVEEGTLTMRKMDKEVVI